MAERRAPSSDRPNASSSNSASSTTRMLLQQYRNDNSDLARSLNGHAFQPSSSRLRQAAAQALARSHSSRNGARLAQQAQAARSSLDTSRPNPPGSGTVNPSIHPQFRSKAVCSMYCNHCSTNLCQRGMRAILLGNTAVELFSTDRPPFGVALVDKDYFTKNCSCRIRDAACLGCGNVVGYHVTHPCERCLEACNNGNYILLCSLLIRSYRSFLDVLIGCGAACRQNGKIRFVLKA